MAENTALKFDRSLSPIPALVQGDRFHVLAATQAAAVLSVAVAATTNMVRLVAVGGPLFYIIGGDEAVAASGNGDYLPAGIVEFVPIRPGQKVSVIAAAAADVNLHIGER